MSAYSKRNVANLLILCGVTPTVIWMILMPMALGGALFSWISAGVVLGGKYLVFLSFCITCPILMWTRSSKLSHPDIWTAKHRIPATAAKFILTFGLLANLGVLMWGQFYRPEVSKTVILPTEESHQIQIQIDKKIQELEALRR